MQFLNKIFQKKLWEKEYGDFLPYDESKSIDFGSWFSSVSFLDDEELKYESKKIKYNEFYVNSHIRFRFPKEIADREKIIITYDEKLSSFNKNSLSEAGILINTGKNYYVDNLDEDGLPIRSNRITLKKQEIYNYSPVIIDFLESSKKIREEENYITITPKIFPLASYGDEFVGKSWGAIDFKKINNFTIKVFVTFNLDTPDFHELVFNIEFPHSLKECEVGFWDKTDFYQEL